ncbi:MAG: zinc ABC transporter substrate-binding protein ZnuA [Alphaproteobacteria bacterium]|nr:zinc ABC transporter substrate-binding protein ZnuA [Alphaproteobacteria bacterium]
MMSWIARRRVLLAAGALAALSYSGPGHAAEPKVIVSIKPIHSLVAGVMEGVGAPVLLIKGAGSPHNYSLRPSEADALENADLIFWVGEDLETFLRKPLAALPKRARVVSLSGVEGVTLLEAREGGVWDAHTDEHAHTQEDDHDHDHEDEHGQEDAHGHEDEDGHAHGEHDMHLWLDPANARAMTAVIATALTDRDPGNAETYKMNADRLLARLDALTAEIEKILAPVRERPYIVFHDAYQYFERRFDLRPAGSITVSPDRAPGARRLYEIRKKIVDAGAACVFSEPQFEPKLVRTVIDGTPARTAELDPLGAAVPPGPAAYPTIMQSLAKSLRDCLGKSS